MASSVNNEKRLTLDVNDALLAICSTGKGRCWHCDRRLPHVERAIRAGWDVQRIDGERVASIILVCPRCQRERVKPTFTPALAASV